MVFLLYDKNQDLFPTIEYTYTQTPCSVSKPYKCPVCNGRGKMPINFYERTATHTGDANCRTCNGTGVLWR